MRTCIRWFSDEVIVASVTYPTPGRKHSQGHRFAKLASSSLCEDEHELLEEDNLESSLKYDL